MQAYAHANCKIVVMGGRLQWCSGPLPSLHAAGLLPVPPRATAGRPQRPQRRLGVVRAADGGRPLGEQPAELPPSLLQPSAQQEPEQPPPRGTAKMPFKTIMLLAGAGALETAYLALSKATGAPVLCPASGALSGCADVLSSPWATFFGVLPLPLAGLAAYGAVFTAAAIGDSRQQAGLDERADETTSRLRAAVLGGGVAMAVTSAYLMCEHPQLQRAWGVLFTQFPGELCPYCLASAGLSFAVFASALLGYSSRELTDAAAPCGALVTSLALALALNFGAVSESKADGIEIPYAQPPINSQSSDQAVRLAKALKAAGAKMYGAFWCSHCFDQKEAFGAEAMADFPYVECYPEGYRKGVTLADECVAAGLKGFPTWVIGERVLEGEQSFEALERALASMEPEAVVAPALAE